MRMGHSSSAAALRYQHVMAGRDAAIAATLDELVQAASGAFRGHGCRSGGTRVARARQRGRKGRPTDRPGCPYTGLGGGPART